MARKKDKRRNNRKGSQKAGGPKPRNANACEGNAAPASGDVPTTPATKSFELFITLKSDMCAGSGDGFSSGIDQDVCYDARGVPYVPARRIKGCLRKAARDIGLEQGCVDALFGARGSRDGGALSISDAAMRDADASGGVPATIDRYTYVRAQTRVDRETGSAEDDTLRFVRVVRHYRDEGHETSFVAKVSLGNRRLGKACTPRQAREHLQNCAKALRGIGMGRNRGFGAVRCVCKDDKGRAGAGQAEEALDMLCERSVGRTTAISYAVRLDSPMMLPQSNGEQSHACIPGTSVLGFFASRMRDADGFDGLFFGGGVRFSPLYPMDGVDRCLPASAFVAKVKGGLRDGECCRADSFVSGPFETPKPLRDGFMSPATWNPVKVSTEVAYHHSTGDEGTLYTQKCLSPGQVMGGFIECPEVWATALREVLSQGPMSFGRSKSAQYSRCSLVPCARDLSGLGSKVDVRKGDRYILLLESDALVLCDRACPAVGFEDLESALREAGALGDWYERCDAEDPSVDHCSTSVSARTVGGYNAKWNQKKPHVRVFEAGSCLVFTAASAATGVDAVGYFGERQSEGYGRVRLVRLDDVRPSPPQHDSRSEEGPDAHEKARRDAVAYADGVRRSYFSKGGLASSFVGRLSMMVDESGYRDHQAFDDDLDVRIASIKDDKKRGRATELVEGLRAVLGGPAWCREHWRLEKECLTLVLTLGKYYLKQSQGRGEA